MEVLQYRGFPGDADAVNLLLRSSMLRSHRRRYQTKVSVATFVSVSATVKVEASGFDGSAEEFDAEASIL
jgi:hypothetical protein